MENNFIVFEGVEGSGKSSQARKLKLWLEEQGKKVFLSKAPGGTEVGKVIREFLLHSKEQINDFAELFLYKADEAQYTQEIKKKLEDGYIVISDRYCYSTIAYQGFARGIPLDVITKLNEISTQGLKPDILFIIDVEDVKQCLERSKLSSGRYDRFESLPVDFHLKVQKGFRSLNYDFLHLIDGNGTIEETFGRIKQITQKFIK